MTVTASTPGVVGTRFVPWLVRFRRLPRGQAQLQLIRVDGETVDPRGSEAATESVHVIFRGLLHDRPELARAAGVEAVPEDDAELVLQAYRRWGEDCLRRLRGIFDVFIWDGDRDRLLAARDPCGVEPLFYARAGEEVLFAASPTTLFADARVPRRPDPIVLVETLYWRWASPEETCLQGIRRVLPGHVLSVSDSAATSRRYWNPFDDLAEHGWVRGDALDAFDGLVERSTSQGLELGPSGVFLSGGFDSVSVAAVAVDLARSRGFPTPWALSMAFPTPETSETEIQVAVANALELPQILLDLEESVAPDGLTWRALEVSAACPLPRTFLFAGAYLELARRGAQQGVRVIMTGGGGDEWLGVDLLLAADLIHRRQFAALYRFALSKVASFNTPLLRTLRAVLWTYGLREVMSSYVRGVLAVHAPDVLRRRRRRTVAERELPWAAPDPKLRSEVSARLDVVAERTLDLRQSGGGFRFYGSEVLEMLDHPVLASDREDDYESGRKAGTEMLHPYWEPELISFLLRVPPELLLQGGREKGLIRGTIARRFPNLGFEHQKKVVASDYHYAEIRRDGPEALRRLGGCKTLVELGVVDRQQVATAIEKGLRSSDFSEVHIIWQLMVLEAWARNAV